MHMGKINVYNLEQVEESFRLTAGTMFRISVDFGPLITLVIDPAQLKMEYQDQTGKIRTKIFMPEKTNKLRAFYPDQFLQEYLAPYLDVLARYPSNIGTVFLADEPYLNGIPKEELERAGRLVRKELDKRNLNHVGLGVIFAGGMFDRDFANLISQQAGAYVTKIDDYYVNGKLNDNSKDFEKWVEIIQRNRLVTYDRAGNMYVNGGLPEGFGVIGFDLYLSTLLLDSTHEQTLAWLANRYPQYGCAQFYGQPMTKIRSRLSFFQDGVVKQDDHYQREDKALLDTIFTCRMGAITNMLKKAASSHPHSIKFLMYSESSNNGLLEFNSKGVPEQKQPEKLVESRVLDEVMRAQHFYLQNQDSYGAGLMYFTYQDEYDKTIKLNIGGVIGMPAVLNNIFNFAKP